MRRSRIALFAALLPLFLAGLVSVGSPVMAAQRWRSIGPHPDAGRMPTAAGRTVHVLHGYKGLLFAGYGDHGDETGPIEMTPFDPKLGRFLGSELTYSAEWVQGFREIKGKLFAPSEDPPTVGEVGTRDMRPGIDYAVRSPSGRWREFDAVSSRHIFDIVPYENDLFLSGAYLTDVTELPGQGAGGQGAAVWRSTDGGKTWSLSLVQPGTPLHRFTIAPIYDGNLYVQDQAPGSRSWVWDGSVWLPGPDLFTTRGTGITTVGWRWQVFEDRLVYLWAPTEDDPRELLIFDGAAVESPVEWRAWDIVVYGRYLYALSVDSQIRRTKDLESWEDVVAAPIDATSLAVFDGHLYVGAREAAMYAMPLPKPTG